MANKSRVHSEYVKSSLFRQNTRTIRTYYISRTHAWDSKHEKQAATNSVCVAKAGWILRAKFIAPAGKDGQEKQNYGVEGGAGSHPQSDGIRERPFPLKPAITARPSKR